MSIPDSTESRAWARALFGTPADSEAEPAPRRNVVSREGSNPPAAISDEARARDYVRRMFDRDYAATEQELP